ncbi:MAG: glycosyltransferase [Bacteroidota bacterium]|nr:glycosyltransferase [Bacteroidota bacterium]
MYFSIIVPVFNRPDEIDELLASLQEQSYSKAFEIVIVEDGSTIDCQAVVEKYKHLNIAYYYKQNSGPGASRNYGMRKAKGNYFLIIDSDCVIPKDYLQQAENSLQQHYVACFGGKDAALDNFTPIQKAINFAMTSVFTTGGIRGNSEQMGKFQPRSFNMGLSKEAFILSGGFGNIHPGEDPDLAMRLWDLGVDTRLFSNVKVYHKRRISWEKFYYQVNKFGKTRVILDLWYPQYAKLVYLFPLTFCLGFVMAILLGVLYGNGLLLGAYMLYFVLCFWFSFRENKSLYIGLLSIYALMIQFFGYARGYAKALVRLRLQGKRPQEAFPELFF